MKKNNYTIGQILVAGATAFLVVLAAVGGQGMRVTNGIIQKLDTVVGVTARANETAGRMLFNESDLQSMTRRAVAAAARHDRKTVDAEVAECRAQLKELGEEIRSVLDTESAPPVKQAAEQFGEVMKNWATEAEAVWALAADFKFDEAVAAEHRLDEYSDHAERLATQIFDAEVAQMEQDKAEAHALAKSGTTVLLLAIGLAGLVAIGWFVTVRRINRTLRTSAHGLRENSDQVVAASGQVSAAAHTLAQGATEQASALEETSASMARMSNMTGQNAANAGRVAQLMGHVDEQVLQSNRSLEEMVSSMNAINESSQKVARIIKTIDEIAFQTNILALNAAVEAARAGEAGMGFAVVADEVRSLAQRSADAAHNTTALIEDSLASTKSGASNVQQLTSAFAGITQSVGQVRALVEQVSDASREQAQGLAQVSESLGQLERVTHEAAATAEESAAASEELNAQAEEALARVCELDALVERDTAQRPAPAAQAARVLPLRLAPRPAPPARESSAARARTTAGTGTYGSF